MASKINLVVILILILTIDAIAKPSRRLNLEIFGTECTILTALVRTFNCEHMQDARNVHYFSDGVIFTKDINDSFDMRIRVDVQYLNSNVTMHFLDYKLDICGNLQTAFQNFIIRMLWEELRRSSNMPYKCPFKADKLYKVDNFTLTRDIFPSYTPEMNFTATITLMYKNVELSRQIATGAISLKSPK